MSASEIIEAILKLPAPEQERVLAVLQSACRRDTPVEPAAQSASDAEFDKAAEKVLREHAALFRRLAQ